MGMVAVVVKALALYLTDCATRAQVMWVRIRPWKLTKKFFQLFFPSNLVEYVSKFQILLDNVNAKFD